MTRRPSMALFILGLTSFVLLVYGAHELLKAFVDPINRSLVG